MITEDYVSFETAKLLKEKGFHISDISMLVGNDNHPFISGNSGYEFLLQKGQEVYPAPTLSVVMKWLREVHHLTIDVFHFRDWKVNIKTIPDDYFKADYSCPELKPTETYEQACEAAIKYCLENLI